MKKALMWIRTVAWMYEKIICLDEKMHDNKEKYLNFLLYLFYIIFIYYVKLLQDFLILIKGYNINKNILCYSSICFLNWDHFIKS